MVRADGVPRWRDERGQGGVEYLGVVAVVAVVVAAVLAVATPVGRTVGDGVLAAACQLLPTCEGAGGGEAGDAPGSRGTGEPGAPGTSGTGGVRTLRGDATVAVGPAAQLEQLGSLPAGEGAVDGYLAQLTPAEQRRLRAAAAEAATDPDVAAGERIGATRLALHDEAERLAADPDVADLAVWEERQRAIEVVRNAYADPDARDAAYERLEDLGDRIDAAPDGSLLAGLRDTEHVRNGYGTADDLDLLADVVDRQQRARHAEDLAPLLRDWADSGRDFLHVEVDLDDGTVRLAELVSGDLDTADHVVVTIPGTGSDAAGFDRGVAGDARSVARTLDTLGEDGTAVIACLCYAPPSNLAQAASGGHADRGGPDLARIIGDLPVADDAAVRGFGHSYGATALGRAVDRHGLELDATVSLGGPGFGSGVRSVDDLPDTAGQIWGVRHDKDPIALAGMHGVNPDRGRFGAHGFLVGDGDLDRDWWKPYQFDAHSLYYRDAESLANIALIGSGRGDEVSGYREGRR